MSNNKKKVIPTNRQDTSQMDELKTEINNLPKDNPKACEGLIRELSKKISEVNNESVKERLHFDLKAVSCLGLNSELKKMVEDNGLNMEAIQLVLKYLTTKEQLGEYFFTHPNEDSESAGLDAVRRRLCPKLEVLGGLLAKGIDVTKPWVQKLVNAAPSLQTLSRISVAELKVRCHGIFYLKVFQVSYFFKKNVFLFFATVAKGIRTEVGYFSAPYALIVLRI